MDACTPKLNAALTNTLVLIKAGNTRLDAYDLYNPAAAVTYLQCFDAAAASGAGSPTLGTTTPTLSIGIPAGGKASLANVRAAFLTGLVIAATTTATGSTAPATALVANLGVR